MVKNVAVTRFIKEKAIALIIVIAALFIAGSKNSFYTPYNFTIIMQKFSLIALTAIGMTMLIMIGEIDLSIGAMVGFGSVIYAKLCNLDVLWVFALLLTLFIAACIGILCGLMVGFLKLPSFLITLVMAQLVRMTAFLFNDGISNVAIFSDSGDNSINSFFHILGTGKIGVFPVVTIIVMVIYFYIWFVMKKTAYGRYLRALSGTENTVRLLSIPVKRMRISVFAISALFTAFAGIINASRLRMGIVEPGNINWEIDAIAAVLIGGTQFDSGKGNILFTYISALFIGIINNCLNGIQLPVYITTIIKCIIILFVLITGAVIKIKKEA